MNHLYKTKKITQGSVAIFLGLLLVILLTGWILLDNILIKLAMVFILVPIYLFLATPLMTLTKKFNYISPMLLYLKKDKDVFEVHSGISFDYLSQIRDIQPGRKWEKKMLQFYLEGMLELIDKIKKNEIPQSSTITGTSYFVENSVLKKIGFRMKEPQVSDRMNFMIGYLDLI